MTHTLKGLTDDRILELLQPLVWPDRTAEPGALLVPSDIPSRLSYRVVIASSNSRFVYFWFAIARLYDCRETPAEYVFPYAEPRSKESPLNKKVRQAGLVVPRGAMLDAVAARLLATAPRTTEGRAPNALRDADKALTGARKLFELVDAARLVGFEHGPDARDRIAQGTLAELKFDGAAVAVDPWFGSNRVRISVDISLSRESLSDCVALMLEMARLSKGENP